MTNLVLNNDKAAQLGRILARLVGSQNMIMKAIKNGDFDMATYSFIIKRHKSQIARLKRFLSKFERIAVPEDQYYEGRLNAYSMALDVM